MAVGSFAEHPTADVVCAALAALVVIYVLSLSCAPVLPPGVPPRGGGVASARQAGLAYEAPAWSTAVSGAAAKYAFVVDQKGALHRLPVADLLADVKALSATLSANVETALGAAKTAMASGTDEVKAWLASYDVDKDGARGWTSGDWDDFRAKAGDMASHYDSEHGAHMKKAMDPSRADWATTSIMRTGLPKYTLSAVGTPCPERTVEVTDKDECQKAALQFGRLVPGHNKYHWEEKVWPDFRKGCFVDKANSGKFNFNTGDSEDMGVEQRVCRPSF